MSAKTPVSSRQCKFALRPPPAVVPKIVVFDLGKVLVDFDYGLAVKKIAERSAVPLRDVERILQQTPPFWHFESGFICKEQFFELTREAVGFQGTSKEFYSYFADIFFEIPLMIRLQADLKAKGFQTWAFSNTNELAIDHIRKKFPFYRKFTGALLSYEHRRMKPDPKFYQILERETGNRGSAILYMDDRAENVAAAIRRGWQGIVHYDANKTVKAVRRICQLD